MRSDLMSHVFKHQSTDTNSHAQKNACLMLDTVKNLSPTVQGTICFAINRAYLACTVAIDC